MRAGVLLAVVAALPLAGCAETGSVLGQLAGGGAADVPLPYYEEHRDAVLPQHERAYRAPVQPGARALEATLTLEMHDGGVGLPAAYPAAVRVEILDPSGAVLAAGSADPAHPSVVVRVASPGAGVHAVRVSGTGASESVDGVRVGAAYSLGVEIRYA